MSFPNNAAIASNEPSEAEIDFFINEMIAFVEARAASVSEQDAIDAFLEHWRGSIQVRSEEAEVVEIRRAG